MKRIIYLAISAVICFSSCQKGQKIAPKTTDTVQVNLPGSWSQIATFTGTSTASALSFVVGNKAYIVAGEMQKMVWQYDPSTGLWTQKASYPGIGYQFLVGFVLNNKIYVGTGYGYNASTNTVENNDFYQYDPNADSWTRVADFPGHPRYGAFSFGLNNYGYIGSGTLYNAAQVYHDVWQFNANTNTWKQVADYPGVGYMADVAVAVAGRGYVGLGNNWLYPTVKDFWQYDPVADSWTSKAGFAGNFQLGEAAGFAIGNDIYVGFGPSSPQQVWKYSATGDQWSRVANFPGSARVEVASFSINNIGYIGFGTHTTLDGSYNEIWQFKP